jgi:hypothetical protein
VLEPGELNAKVQKAEGGLQVEVRIPPNQRRVEPYIQCLDHRALIVSGSLPMVIARATNTSFEQLLFPTERSYYDNMAKILHEGKVISYSAGFDP